MSKKEEYKIIKIDGEDTDYQISKSNGWLIRNKNKPDKFLTVNRKRGTVQFKINGKTKNCTVKKLFSETFIPNPQHFKYVIFKNYNKQDELTIDNLEWGTRSMAEKRSRATNTNRKTKKGRSISMYKEKKEEEEPIIFESISDAAKYILKNKEKLNLTFETTRYQSIATRIKYAIKNKKGFKYGFKFMYNDDIILTDEECKEQGIERKEVPGFSKYIAQTDGRVYYDRGKNSYYLKYQIVKKTGYCKMHLMDDDNKDCTKRVNRIIGMTFLEDFDPKLTVNHRNGDKMNNDISNLEMMTIEEQQKHARETGLNKGTIKAINMCDKNNDTIVLRSFESLKAAAEYLKTIEEFQNRKVKIMVQGISRVINGRQNTACGYIWKLK